MVTSKYREPFIQITQHYISEDLNPLKQGCENLKSQKNEDSITDKTNLNTSSFKSVIAASVVQR
jgi:hypothetical protein